MKMFVDIQKIYLYREPVVFHKAIDKRLALLMAQKTNPSSYEVPYELNTASYCGFSTPKLEL